MTRRTRLTCRVSIAIATIIPVWGLIPFTAMPFAQADSARITSIVSSPKDPTLQFGVDALQEVVRSTDGGRSWTPVFEPGDAEAPDPSTPGACLPGNYDRVTFLAINPLQPTGIYVGTDGVVGDYLDNGCGNLPGGLFFSADGVNNFVSLNHGLPADSDARGGGSAWGVQALVFDPHDKAVMYAVTDASFLAIPSNAQPGLVIAPGIYRTVETGAQWDPAYAGIAATACQFGPCRNPGSLAVVPDQPRVLLYASDTGFYRSEDRGDSWRRTGALLFGTRPRFLTRIDPFETQLAYVVTDSSIFRTSDGGLHLSRLTNTYLPAAGDVINVLFDSQKPPNITFSLASGRHVTVRDSGPAPGPPATLAPLKSATPTATPPARGTPTPSRSKPTSTPRLASPSPTSARTTATMTATAVTRPSPTVAPTSVPARYSVNAAWPMTGHDAGQSYADAVGSILPSTVKNLHVRWQATGETPQIVADGTVYAIDALGHVQSRDAATGAVKHAYQSTTVQGLAYNAPLVYFNRGSEIRIVTATTADWTHSATYGTGDNAATFDSFILSGNTIFTGAGQASSGSTSRYFAFDAKTGKQLWQHDGSQSSVPCVTLNSLYLGFGALGNGDSYLLNATTGAILRELKHIGTAQWHAAGSEVYASILSGGGSRLRASIRAYDPVGNTLWVAHDILFGAALPGMLFGITSGAVDARSALDGHRLWKSKIPGFESVGIGSLVVSGGLVFVQSTDGRINALDRDTGRLLRTVSPPYKAALAGNLIVGAGMVFESLNRSASGGVATLVGFGA